MSVICSNSSDLPSGSFTRNSRRVRRSQSHVSVPGSMAANPFSRFKPAKLEQKNQVRKLRDKRHCYTEALCPLLLSLLPEADRVGLGDGTRRYWDDFLDELRMKVISEEKEIIDGMDNVLGVSR